MFTVGNHKVTFWHSVALGYTQCTIYTLGLPVGECEMITSTARCSKRDQFNRNTGRKIALARALTSFPRYERRAFWQAYYQARGGRW